jgi:hypothetical protein
LKLEIGKYKLGRDKVEIGNWEEQYKSMKAKFPISMFS